MVIDKIKYEEGEFAIASSRNNAFTLSSKDLSVFSNRFYKEKDNTLIFCTLQQTESLSASNTKGVYPKIYQFDLTSNTSKTLFPKTTDLTTLSSVFSLSSVFTGNFNINIVNVERPALTYNSFNDVYKLTYIAVDNNNYFHIFDIEFDIVNDEVKFLGTRFYKADKKYLTTSFANTNTIFTYINTISGSYTLNTNTGVLSI